MRVDGAGRDWQLHISAPTSGPYWGRRLLDLSSRDRFSRPKHSWLHWVVAVKRMRDQKATAASALVRSRPRGHVLSPPCSCHASPRLSIGRRSSLLSNPLNESTPVSPTSPKTKKRSRRLTACFFRCFLFYPSSSLLHFPPGPVSSSPRPSLPRLASSFFATPLVVEIV